jgi:hypothetical protein
MYRGSGFLRSGFLRSGFLRSGFLRRPIGGVLEKTCQWALEKTCQWALGWVVRAQARARKEWLVFPKKIFCSRNMSNMTASRAQAAP